MSGYIGTQPVPQATQTRDVFTATSGQTSFATSGYTPNFLDVWLNGVKLVDGDDFTATNGSEVVLTTGATAGDTVEVLAYTAFSPANVYTIAEVDAVAQSVAMPAGSVIWYASDTAPTGYIKANGATVSRTTYADLFAAIGTTFGVGDGSTTFQIPDLRGEFIRGWDDSRGVDSGRLFGSAQADAFKSHTHDARDGTGGSGTNSITTGGGNFSGQDYSLGWRSSTTYTLIRETGDIETRPRNISMLACIKY